MRYSLHSHIIYLENKIQSFRDRLTRSRLTPGEIQSLKMQIAHAELALEYYREAYALELSISSSDPPNSSGAGSRGGAGSQGNSTSDEKKEGLVMTMVRAGNK